MKKHTLAAVALAGAVGYAVSGASAQAMTKITIGHTPGGSGFHIPLFIAMDKGFFKKEGLDASFVVMEGKALVTAGMGGAIDFVPIPGGGTQAILKGAPLRFVVGESLISQWAIVVNPKIKTVKDLEGKTLGYGRPGSADYDEGEITLHRFFHMDVGRSYKVISFASESSRVAALINGSIQGALVSFPHAAQAQVKGYKILLKTGDYLPRVGGTVWVTKDYLAKHRETCAKFIRAVAEAEQYLAHDKAGSVPVIQKYFGIKSKKVAGFIWNSLHNEYGADIPHGLLVDLFKGRLHRLESSGLWPKNKPMPDPDRYVARKLLTSTLRGMGYYLQPPPHVQGKLSAKQHI